RTAWAVHQGLRRWLGGALSPGLSRVAWHGRVCETVLGQRLSILRQRDLRGHDDARNPAGRGSRTAMALFDLSPKPGTGARFDGLLAQQSATRMLCQRRSL